MGNATPPTPDDVPPMIPVVVQVTGGAAVRIVDPAGGDDMPEHDSGLAARTSDPCSLFAPGHNVHVIQVRLAIRTPSRAYRLLGVDGQTVTVQEDGRARTTWWLHDTDAVRAALLLDDRPVVHLHGHGMARIGTTLLYPCVDGAPEPCSAATGP